MGSFYKGTIQVTLYIGEGRGRTTYKVPAPAWYASDAPGLAVHRPIDWRTGEPDPRGGWRISHVDSGSALDIREFKTRAAALACCRRLAELGSWTVSADYIRNDVDRHAATAQIMADARREEQENGYLEEAGGRGEA